MNQVEMKEKVEELFKDEEYRKKFFALKSAEEMSDELAKHDIDVSAEELRKIYSLAKKKEAGELSDEELESISGGHPLVWIAVAVVTFFTAAAC